MRDGETFHPPPTRLVPLFFFFSSTPKYNNRSKQQWPGVHPNCARTDFEREYLWGQMPCIIAGERPAPRCTGGDYPPTITSGPSYSLTISAGEGPMSLSPDDQQQSTLIIRPRQQFFLDMSAMRKEAS